MYRLCIWQYVIPLALIAVTTAISVLALVGPESPLWGLVTPLGIVTGLAILWPIGAFLMLGPLLIKEIAQGPIERKAWHIGMLIGVGGIGPVLVEFGAIVLATLLLSVYSG